MTDVVETFRKIAYVGDIKIITIQTDAACDSGHLLDMHSDATTGGVVMEKVLNVLIQDDAGADEEVTWVESTGVITMGTLAATGIHNITIFGY